MTRRRKGYKMDDLEEQFFGCYFDRSDRAGRQSADEEADIAWCYDYVGQRFRRMKYILGLAVDFLLLAQSIRKHDPALRAYDSTRTDASILAAYPRVTQRGDVGANTLTLTFNDETFGIRKLEELVRSYFYKQRRLGYPSAYVYNTGQWAKYRDLLGRCFRLSAYGRYALVLRLLSFGREHIEAQTFKVRAPKSIGEFECVLGQYPRAHADENAGLAFQAIAFGVASVLYGHLSISAASVRTGSARQNRFGDIDAYAGEQLVVSIEVKDIDLDSKNYETQIESFVAQVSTFGVRGLILCNECSAAIEAQACSAAPTLLIVRHAAILQMVRLWDEPQQTRAIEAMLHYLANIEHNAKAADRLKMFLAKHLTAS